MTWLTPWVDKLRGTPTPVRHGIEPVPYVAPIKVDTNADATISTSFDRHHTEERVPWLVGGSVLRVDLKRLDEVRRARLLVDIEWWAHRLSDDDHRTLTGVIDNAGRN